MYRLARSGWLQKYFVYVFASCGFLFLNLLGSLSPNVTAYRAFELHYANLATACSFAFTYFWMLRLKPAVAYTSLRERFLTNGLPRSRSHLLYMLVLAGAGVAAIVLFSMQGAEPLILRFEYFGKWDLLVWERIRIVQHPGFYWFSLGIFEIPLFLVLMAMTIRYIIRSGPHNELKRVWDRLFAAVLVYSFLLALIYLNKLYLVFLLAALLLVYLLFERQISWKKTAFGFSLALAVLFVLYRIYAGAVSGLGIIQIIFHRVLEVYAWGGAVAFDLFPRTFDFLHGTSIVNPNGLFPYKQVIVADLIYGYIYDNRAYGNVPLPAVYENYVNFGWWGIAASLLIIPAAIIALTRLSWTSNLFLFVLALFLTLKTSLLWQSPLWFGLFDITLIFLVIGLALLKLVLFQLIRSPRW